MPQSTLNDKMRLPYEPDHRWRAYHYRWTQKEGA